MICRRAIRFFSLVVFLFLAAAGIGKSALAATWSWDPSTTGNSGGTGTWDTGSWWNGSSDVAWSTAGQDASFGGAAGTVTLNGPISAADLIVNTAGYTFQGNTLTLTSGSVNMNASSGTISSAIAGSLGMVKTGSGDLWVSGANTVSGGLAINAGTLTINGAGGSSGAFVNSAISVAKGAELDLNTVDSLGYSVSLPLTVSGVLNKLNDQSETVNRPIILSGGTMTSTGPSYVNGNGAWDFFGGSLSSAANTTNYITGSGSFSLRSSLNFITGPGSNLNISVPIIQNSNTSNTPFNVTGQGTVTLNGSVVNSYSGSTTVNGGTLLLNFANLATPTNFINSASSLSMGGGALSILAKSSLATSQSFAGLNVTAGANVISVNSNGGGGTTLALNAITQSAGSGGTVKFTLPASGSITTTTANTNSMIGGWAIIDNGNSTYSWAANNGSNVIAAAATTTTAGAANNWAPSGNVTLASNTAANSLIEIHDILLNGHTLTIGSGGIIFQSNNFWMQNSTGTLTSGLASGELFVHTPNAGLTDTEIRVNITNNGSTAVSLIKDGPGNLIIQPQTTSSNLSTYTGNTIINGGTLTLSNNGANAPGGGGLLPGTPNIYINAGGVLALNAPDVVGYTGGKEALTINSGGTVSNVASASRVTIQNLITMTGGVLGGTGAGDVDGLYSFNNAAAGITATSDPSGNPSVISAKISAQNTTMLFTVNRGPAAPASDLNVTGAIVPFGANTYGIIQGGNGVMQLLGSNTYTGGTTISGGTLQLGGAGVLGNGSYSAAISNSGAFVVSTTVSQVLSGAISGNGSLTTTGNSSLALITATNTYSGGTTISGGQILLGNGANENQAGLGTGPVTIAGGTLHMEPGSSATVFDIPNSFTINGGTVIGEDGVQHIGTGAGATVQFGALGGTVQATWNGKDVYLDGILSGNGPLTLSHGPTTGRPAIIHVTNAANTYNGTVSVSGAGQGVTLDLDSNAALQFAAANLTAGGVLTLTQTGVSTLAGLMGTSGSLEPAAVAGAYTLNVNSPGNATYGGTLTDNTGILSLAISGSGNLVLSNANPYSGGTSISAGTLQIGNGGTNGTMGSGVVVNNAVLAFNRSDTGLGVNFGNAISGSGSIVQFGSGLVALAGSNSYMGGTTISAGTLQLANLSALGSTAGTLAVNGGALDINGYSPTLGAVTVLSGSIINSGAAAALQGASYYAQGGYISASLGGSGALTAAGGLVTLAGSSNYTGGTTVSSGTLQLGNGATSIGAVTGNISVSNQAALVFANPIAQQYAGAISGSGSVTKNAAGTLTLTGSSTYTGATNVNTGTLLVNGSLPSNNSVSVAAAGALGGSGSAGLVTIATGGTVDVSQNGANSYLSLASLNFNANGTINFGSFANYSSTASIPAAISAGTVNAIARGSVSLTFPIGPVPNGTYDLLSFVALTGYGSGAFSLASGGPSGLGGRQSASLIDTGSVLQMNVNGDYPIWTGSNGTAWVGQSNWLLFNAGTPTDFQIGDTVQFNDVATTNSGGTTAVVNTTANISGADVYPASVTFNNNVLSYTVTGTNGINGSGSVILNGSGMVTIANSNAYTGGTLLNAGQLNINNASAIGMGPLTIAGSGVTLNNTSGTAITLSTNNNQFWNSDFTFAGSNNLNLGSGTVTLGSSRIVTVEGGNLTVGGPITGVGAGLTLAGNGQLTLAGANTYNSGTTILSGTLNAANNSALSTGSVTFNPSAGSTAVLAFTSASPAINGTLIQSGAGTSMIVLGNAVAGTPTILTLGGNSVASTFSGAISDMSLLNSAAVGSLVKAGNGLLVLNGNNSYSGTTTITSGTLQIGNGTSGEQLASPTVNDYGVFAFNHADTLTFAGAVSGSGSLVKQGAGLLALTGSNSFTGGTTISGGTLQIGDGLTTNGAMAGNILNNATLAFASPAASTIAGVISGAGGVEKSGSGTVTLSAFNTYTGGTTVNGGTLALAGGNNGIGVIRGVLTINPGAEVNITTHDVLGFSNSATGLSTLNIIGGVLNQSYPGNETVTGVAINLTGGTMSATGANGDFDMFTNGFGNTTITTSASSVLSVISAAVNFRSATTLITVASGSTPSGVDLLASGTLEGAFGFNKAGPGVMQISGSNIYTGTATVSGGTLQTANNGALGTGSAGLTLAVGAVVDLYGYSPSVGAFNGGGTVDLSKSGSSTLTVGGGGASGVFSGTIQNSTGMVGLAKTGAGTQFLSGTNTYTGGTFLSGGTLNFTPGAVPLAANSITFNGGALQWAASNTQDVSSAVAPIGAGGAGIDTNGNNVTFASSLSGTGGLTKYGAGTLNMSVANTYSGATAISGGTLNVAHPLALQNSTVTVATNNSLSFSVSAATLGALSGVGNVNANGAALTVGGNGASTLYVGSLTNGGGFVKAGAGLMTLGNTQSYTGATTIAAGTLQLSVPNVGIKFATNRNGGTYNVTGSAGAVAMSNWNNLAGTNQAAPQSLVDSSGNPSAATVTWGGVSDNYDALNGNQTDQNAQLLNSYLDNSSAGAETVSVSGVPYANYNVYVYFASDANGRDGSVSIGAATFNYSTTANVATRPYPLILTTTTSGAYPAANYAEFSNLSGASFTISQVRTANSGIAAVEIVGENVAENILPASAPLTIAGGATLDLGGVSQQVASLNDAAPGLGGTVTNSGSGAASLTVTTSGSSTFSGSIQNGNSTTSLVMNGNGTQVLAGSNTYSGGTTVNSGILSAGTANAFSPNASMTVNGGTLDASRGAQTVASLNVGAFGLLNLSIGNAYTLTSSGTASFAGTLNLLAGSGGTADLINYLSYSGSFSTTTGVPSGYALQYTPTQLDLIFNGAPMWVQGSGNWSDGFNWSGNSSPNGAGQGAIFNQSNSGALAINLDVPVTLGTLQFNSATTGYTLSGNTLTFNNNGGTSSVTVLSGTHSIGSQVVVTGGALDIAASSSSVLGITGNISDDGSQRSLILDGDGTGQLVLSGVNTYGGQTVVNAGTLVVDSTTALPDGTSLIVGQGASSLFAPAVAGPAAAVSAVPEPGTLVLLLAALWSAMACHRFSKRPRARI
jgi:fibronectin-binding autotransporter adhesin